MLENWIERLLFASRWLLAPVYLGLSLALLALGIRFFIEIWHVLAGILAGSESGMVLTALSLIDLVLVGSLIVMVTFSGYESFVSRIDTGSEGDALGWLSKLDSGTLEIGDTGG
jgi:uncharacterized protein (TIGR00645 family)